MRKLDPHEYLDRPVLHGDRNITFELAEAFFEEPKTGMVGNRHSRVAMNAGRTN